MPITLIETLDAVGADHLTFQTLSTSALSAKVKGRGPDRFTEIAFGTRNVGPGDIGLIGSPVKVGLIVWIDAERWNNAIASIQAAQGVPLSNNPDAQPGEVVV